MLDKQHHTTLNKDRQLPPAQDYNFLREAGLTHLSKLSGKLWTDHNAHDPGITMLEALCYALTDLGYRTAFPIEDLLVKGPNEDAGLEQTGLFPTHEILPTAPLTINDYRKLLLKLEGIRNAWLRPLSGKAEQYLLVDCRQDELTFGHFHYTLKDGPLAGQELVLYLPEVQQLAHKRVQITGISFAEFHRAPGTLALGDADGIVLGEAPEIIELALTLDAVHDDYFAPGTFPPKAGLQLIDDDESGYFTFQVISQNDELLLRGEKYTSKSSRNRGVESFTKNGPLEQRWKRQKTADDKFFFTLKAGNNKEIGRSIYYDNADEMLGALEQLRSEQFELQTETHVPQEKIVSKERQWRSAVVINYRRNRKSWKSKQVLQLNTTFDTDTLPESVLELLKDPQSYLWKNYWDKQIRLNEAACNTVIPRGLYDVMLELEVHELFGSLNERKLYHRITFGELKGVVLAIEWKGHFDPGYKLVEVSSASVNMPTPELIAGQVVNASVQAQFHDGEHTIADLRITVVDDKPNSIDLPQLINEARLIEALIGSEQGEKANGLFSLFWQKQQHIHKTLQNAQCLLHAHRNLCEDFNKIDTVSSQQVAVCVDIDVRSNTDIEVLQANIYLAIENYLNPPLRYYTLSELLEDGYSPDEIFDGPYLHPDFNCGAGKVFSKPGFIKTEELEATTLREQVFTSDLMRILLDFKEIIAVKNLLLRSYDDEGKASETAEPWCLSISAGKQPVLNANYSKFLFFKNEIPYAPNSTETKETLHYLRMLAQKAAYVEPRQTLPIPEGRYRDLHEYFPVQHDLPQAYGTGKARLPLDSPPKRLAEAKQLKAYLLFFEQVLADFLSQLQHAKWLLSPENIQQTYFSRFLDEESISKLEQPFIEEFYHQKNGQPILADEQTRRDLYETPAEFVARRNRLLDHLLGRFAEQFTDYTLLLYNLNGDRIQSDEDLVGDKVKFLNRYPKVSRNRGQAFNYRPTNPVELWDSMNISGFKRRLGRLIGIEDLSLRNLHCPTAGRAIAKTQKVAGQDRFFIVIKSDNNTQLFRSEETFASRPQAEVAIAQIAMHLRSPGVYHINNESGALSIQVDDLVLTHKDTFDSINSAELRIRSILSTYDSELLNNDECAREGFYVIEHLLLRPLFRATDRALLPVCLNEDCEHCGEEDPYSFRITVVLPYWPGRHKNLDFRRFFERLVREEAPAHVQAKICWVSNRQIQLLGERYHSFLIEKSKVQADPLAYNLALRELVGIMGQLNTVQPEAHLHDCGEDGGEVPVRLGYTNLGDY